MLLECLMDKSRNNQIKFAMQWWKSIIQSNRMSICLFVTYLLKISTIHINHSFRIKKSIWILLLNKFSYRKTRLKVLKLLKAAALARHNGRACLDFLSDAQLETFRKIQQFRRSCGHKILWQYDFHLLRYPQTL